MMRLMAGFAAWAAGTAIAVCVAWLGANVVVRDAGVQSGLPVVNAAVAPPSATSAPVPANIGPASAGPGSTSTKSGSGKAADGKSAGPATVTTPAGSPAGSAAGKTSAAPSASASAAASTAGVHAYTMTGGRVTLDVTATSAQLVTAVPDAGWSVQTWNETDWLRVDFSSSSGTQVSSLIAAWNGHAPTITVSNG